LSEVMNAEVTNGEEGRSFSRRRVVKGVAWSVPVIVTAIAAPAAAASPAAVAASVTLGAVGATTAAGDAGVLAVQAPTTFDIQTGSANTGTSVSYTITIEAVKANQKAFMEIVSASPGTGSSVKGQKLTTFTGTVSTSTGNQAIHVVLAGYRYSGARTSGTYTYTITLTVTVSGSSALVKTSSLTVTYP